MKKSWKTTLGGSLNAFGLALPLIDPAWTKAGLVIAAIGAFINGVVGRDNSITSEDAGLNPKPEEPK